MHEFVGLSAERVYYHRVAVAETACGNACGEVHVFPPCGIAHEGAVSFDQSDGCASIGGENVLRIHGVFG